MLIRAAESGPMQTGDSQPDAGQQKDRKQRQLDFWPIPGCPSSVWFVWLLPGDDCAAQGTSMLMP